MSACPENTAIKRALGQIYATACGFVIVELSGAYAKCKGILTYGFPLQAQTPLNNTKRLSENTFELTVTVKGWLWDLQFMGCGLLCASHWSPSLIAQACGKV